MEPKKHRKGNSGKLTRRDVNRETYKQEKKAGLPNSTKHLLGVKTTTLRLAGRSANNIRASNVGRVRDFKPTNFNTINKRPVSHFQKPLPAVHSPLSTKTTSWGGVASWYDKHLEGDDTYHTKVILPSLLRVVGDIKGKDLLDLACGQGFFSQALSDAGANVTGIDIGKELIAQAENLQKGQTNKIHYFVSGADDLYMLKDKSMDLVVCVLALQNIENITGTFKEVSRILRKGGKFIFVLNHPAFRNPKESGWGWDDVEKVQYRRVDSYLSEAKVKIDMTPGNLKEKKFTISFHRPLQLWSKLLSKHNFAITRMEEWESHRISENGPRQNAENKARKEIPLFLAIETVQL